MKKILILLLCLLLTASITGCGTQSIKPIDTIEGNMKTYSEMSDGTWQCDGHIYKYRLEISGRLSNAVKDSTYIYLSNIEDITFEQAWKASGLSSNMDDYFDIDEAVLVELPDWQLSVLRWRFLWDLITVISCYRNLVKPLKILNFSLVSFPLHLVLCYIVLTLFMNLHKGKNKGKKIW